MERRKLSLDEIRRLAGKGPSTKLPDPKVSPTMKASKSVPSSGDLVEPEIDGEERQGAVSRLIKTWQVQEIMSALDQKKVGSSQDSLSKDVSDSVESLEESVRKPPEDQESLHCTRISETKPSRVSLEDTQGRLEKLNSFLSLDIGEKTIPKAKDSVDNSSPISGLKFIPIQDASLKAHEIVDEISRLMSNLDALLAQMIADYVNPSVSELKMLSRQSQSTMKRLFDPIITIRSYCTATASALKLVLKDFKVWNPEKAVSCIAFLPSEFL
jgi:hypothetical protein